MTAAFILGQNVDLTNELGEGVNGTGLGQNLAALDLALGDAAEQRTDVVAGLGVVEQLVEHLDTGDDGLAALVGQADDLDFLAELELTTLNSAGSHGAAAGDREHVLDGHQEGQGVVTRRSGDIVVDSVHEFLDAGILGGVGILGLGNEGVQSGTADDGDVVAGELVGGEQLADFHLDELEELLIVDLVALVQEHDDGGHADLTGEQDVLAGLSHGAVGSGDDEDRAVHLSSAGDHVLDIVGVARAVDVRIVAALDLLTVKTGAVIGLILDVRGVDRDAAGLLFGGLVDLVVSGEVSGLGVGEGENLRDRSGEGGLTMVDVADGTDVDMRLGSVKSLLCHYIVLLV